MGKTENIFEKTAKLLKENNLTLDILTPDVIEEIQEMTKSHTDISVTNLTEQVDPEDYGIIDGKKGKEDGAERLYKQHAHDNEDYVDNSPFTKLEVSILNQLHKQLSKEDLQSLTDESPNTYGAGKKFWEVLKIFGIPFQNDSVYQTKMSKYAKWAFDNWREEGDYGSIESPIKTPLKWYDVDRAETGSQIEYRDGSAEVLGYDEDNAGERADLEWYDWGGDMETTDYGDYETYDSSIERTDFLRIAESDLRTKALISIGGIQRDKVTTPKFIKNIFKSSGHKAKSSGIEPEDGEEWNTFYTPGTNIDLNSDVQRVRDRIRFEEYGEMFQQGIEGRGFAFEGMLAGLFNGEPMEAGGKEDIKVGNEYYSIKQSNPGDAWDTGSLMVGFNFAVENMVRDGFSEEEIPPTPIDLMVAGEDYIGYKAQMLTESFKATNGQPLQWIFAHVLNDKQIEYEVLDSEELISTILSSDCSQGTRSQACAVGRSRKGDTGVRIKSRFVLGNSNMITFPEVTEDEIKSIIYDPEGDRVEDKIRRIFKDPNKVSQYTVEYIKNNPKEFLASVNEILPNLTIEQKNLAYNLLMEESDVFGQGLMDPIKPEEFEGTEEEWEKLMSDVEEEGEDYDYEDDVTIYTGGKTDPERGFVAPSKEVTNNVCKVEGFCQEQGPITFGQLKALVEAATSKRIQADIGRGVFKMLWRIIPFFVPQILLAAVGVTATRAFNKIITPALTDTRGYKEWWGKAVLKAMDIAEGDYIPDIAMGDDPLSKVFFISDGLMSMIKDKYKLKFARYVAEYASTRPSNEPVPDWFVENLLRDYLNQKFLLNPPLPVKIDIEKTPIKESENPFGLLGDNWKDQILKHEKNLTKNELKYKKLADNVEGMNVTIPVDIQDGAEPVIGTTDITFTIIRPYIFQGLRGDFFDNMRPSEEYKDDPKRPTVIKYDLVFRYVEPGSLLEELLEENSIEGMDIHNISARERLMELLEEQSYSINEVLMKDYFKLYGVTIGRLGKIYDTQQLQEQNTYDESKYEDKDDSVRLLQSMEGAPQFTDRPSDDAKLNVSPEALWNYLDTNHKKSFIKAITPTLSCIVYNCYDGWKDDPDNEWDEEDFDLEDHTQGNCNDCSDELNYELEKLDKDLVKLGFAQEDDGDGYDNEHRKTWLEKPYPHSYNLWIDGVVKEINPRFYVDANDDISYVEDRMKNQPILKEHIKEINPTLKAGDIIRVIDVDGEHARMPERFGTYKVVNVGSTYDEYYDMVPYSEGEPFDVSVYTPEYISKQAWGRGPSIFTLYRGDTWIYNEKDRKTITEHQESKKLNPELMVGDTILVVDVDRERERGKTQYTTPGEQMRPEKFVPYTVVDKKSNGSQSKWSWKYTLVPEGKLEEYEESLDKGWGNYEGYEKLLYPWIYEWIFANTPKANKVDRLTSTEHQEPKLNPQLMIGDEVTVVDVDSSFGTMNTAERFKDYVVTGIKQSNQTQEIYYEVTPIGETEDQLLGRMLAGGGRIRREHLYPTDSWMFKKGFLRGEHLTEDDSLNDLIYRDEPKDKHKRRMGRDLGSLQGFPIGTYKNMPPPENESDTTEEEINHLEAIPVDDDFVNSADNLDLHFKKFLNSKGLEWPGKELKKVVNGVRTIILQLKYHYNRPRPFQVAQAKGLKLDSENLKSASTPSYPSGHATQGRFIGRYLADLYPEYGDELRQIGDDIAFSRNMAKVHYPSDSEFGKLLGDKMYEYVYQEDMEPALQEQYDMVSPLEAKRRDSTSQLYSILDDNFNIRPHPRGELIYDGKQMALYSHQNDMFVPISDLYDSIDGMTEAGLPKEDIGIFIDIVTDWVNSRMVSKPQLYEQLMDIDKEKVSPDLKVGDRVYVWDIVPDPQPPGGHDSDLELPTTSISVVTDGPFTDRDEESFRGGIEYEVRDEISGETYGLYAGQVIYNGSRYTYDGRDKWIILPKKPLKENKSFIQKVRRRTINEALEPEWSIRRGRQHYALNRNPESGEQITEFNDYLVKNSPFIYDGLEYHLSAIPGNMPNSAKIDLFIPQLDKGEDADKIWSIDNIQVNNAHFPRQTQTYNNEYRDRIREFVNEMEEIGKLFSIDTIIPNRNINRPWSRTPDSYGNESIRPGTPVPYHTPQVV